MTPTPDDDGIDLAECSNSERAYLRGFGYDVYCDSYKYYRGEMVKTIRARQAERAALQPEIDAAFAELDRVFVPTVARRYADLLLRRDNVTVTWTRTRPAAARVDTRHIFTPWIETEEDLGTFEHEYWHVLKGACAGPGHQPDPTITDAHACLACEVSANILAMKNGLWSPRIQQDLGKALGTYLRRVPADPDVRRAARRFIAGTTWREHVHRTMQLEEIREIAAEALRPRLLTRWERQYVEMRAWAREARR